MQRLVWQNSKGDEINLTSGNYGITEWQGFSNADLNVQSQQVPFQDGGVFLDALIEQRELSVTLAMNDNGNLEQRYRMRRELIHSLNPKLGEGYLIYTNDFISKRIKCVAQIPLFETHNSNDSGTPKASLAWTACEPYWEDLEETEVYITDLIMNINNEGDIPCNPQIRIEEGSEPSIMNGTTAQKIKCNIEDVVTPIYIDTRAGNKKVYTEGINIQRIQTFELNFDNTSDVAYSMKNGLIRLDNFNNTTLRRSKDGGKTWIPENILESIYNNILTISNKYFLWSSSAGSQRIFLKTPTQSFEIMTEGNKDDVVVKENDENSFDIYVLYHSAPNVLKHCTCQIVDDTLTQGDWETDDVPPLESIVYNPYLEAMVGMTVSTPQKCYIKSGWAWEEKGQPLRSSPKITYIDATKEMIIYGSQYGYVETSRDGVTWTNRMYTDGLAEKIIYNEKDKLYVAVGSLDSIRPFIGISKDLESWKTIPCNFTKNDLGQIRTIAYDPEHFVYCLTTNGRTTDDLTILSCITDLSYIQNQIQNLSADSDLSFKLDVGVNNILINGTRSVYITYRQKYIGV